MSSSSTWYTCARGHRWEQDESGAEVAVESQPCPVCGEAGATFIAGDSATGEIPPVGVPSSGGLLSDCLVPAEAGTPAGDALPPPPGTALRPPKSKSDVAPADDDLLELLSAPQQPDEIGRLGGYRVLRILGEGGMGMVYEAEDPRLTRRVALKVMRPGFAATRSARSRFLREARAAARLSHDHVVTVFEVGEERGIPFLAMQLLRGESLRQRIDREGTLSVSEVLRIGRETAAGLAEAHAHHLHHRDIKPDNIWLEKRGVVSGRVVGGGKGDAPLSSADHSPVAPHQSPDRVKILDFGLARSEDEDLQLTQTGAIIGTLYYMSPEQAAGAGVDHRCDLYSLGCLMYRMATGRLPVSGANTASVLVSLSRDIPPAPEVVNPAVPASVSALVMKLLEKDPAARYQTANEVVAAIEGIERTLTHASETAATAPAEPVGSNVRSKSPVRRRVATVAAGFLLLLGAVIVLSTGEGTLRVRVSEADAEVLVDGDRKIQIDSKRLGKIELSPGRHELVIRRGDETLHTQKFTLWRGRDLLLEAAWEPKQIASVPAAGEPAKAAAKPGVEDPDRRVAEQALSLGAAWVGVSTSAGYRQITRAEELPAEPFHLRYLVLRGARLPDPSLELLRGLKHLKSISFEGVRANETALECLDDSGELTELHLAYSGFSEAALKDVLRFKKLDVLTLRYMPITDAGLEQIVQLEGLRILDLQGTKVTEEGIKALLRLPKLQQLTLSHTQVGDRGLETVRSLTALWALYIEGARFTDAGLAHLRSLPNLRSLYLRDTRITDAGLAHLKLLPKLTVLDLGKSEVTDAGLEHLVSLRNLTDMKLKGAHITDAGLKHLAGLPKLARLDLEDTAVTMAGVQSLQASLPKCEVTWAAIDPDRRAAEAVLSWGGWIEVSVDKKRIRVMKASELPQGPFHLVVVGMMGRTADPTLEVFRGLTHLEGISFEGSGAKESAVAVLTGNQELAHLQLAYSGFSEAVLERVVDFKKLWGLTLRYMPITDAGLEQLTQLENLKFIDLQGTKVTDEGLKALQRLPKLEQLTLSHTRTGDRGLEHLKPLTKLMHLHLSNTGVTDDGLEHLRGLDSIKELDLAGTRISDAGLKRLEALPKLVKLNLVNSGVTDAGVEGLIATLPKCEVQVGSDRRAAEWALSLGGQVTISLAGKKQTLEAGGPLPGEAFQVVAIDLPRNQQVTDVGLKNLRGLAMLWGLSLHLCPGVTDAGMAHLKSSTRLRYLDLQSTQVTDAVLEHMAGMTEMDNLNLTNARLTDRGAQRLRQFPRMRWLYLASTQISDSALEHLSAMTALERLNLDSCKITNASLVQLQRFTTLKQLNLSRTKINDAGLRDVRSLVNLSHLWLEGTQTTDAGLEHLKPLTQLQVLRLGNTGVTDAGLGHLSSLTKLTELQLANTQVTDAGLARLWTALPNCKIVRP